MRTLTIDAASAESAVALCEALSQFRTEMVHTENGGYQVRVALGGSRETVEVLSAIRTYVTQLDAHPARVELDGRRYMLHAD